MKSGIKTINNSLINCIVFLIFAGAVLTPLTSYAADHCVRSGLTYNGDGSTWAAATSNGGVGAFNELPTTFVRGDTYYIADGTYGEHLFSTPESGTSYIYIKKATTTAHGTNSGWDNSYGGGQAIFTGPTANDLTAIIRFRTGYWVFDGVKGNSNIVSLYGFKISADNCNEKNYLLGVPGIGDNINKITNVTVSHTALINCGGAYDYTQMCIYSVPSHDKKTNGIIISNNYLVGGSSNIGMREADNMIIENNYFDSNWSSSENHGQQISPGAECNDIILRNNIFNDSQIFVVGCHKANNYRWKIYNNIVIGGREMSAIWANADSGTADVIKQWEIHNNTYVNVNCGGRGVFFVGSLTSPATDKSHAYNNLAFNCIHPRFDNPAFTANAINHDYNSFYNCSGTIIEEANIEQSDDPQILIDASAMNFNLSKATAPGKIDLPVLYKTDIKKIERGTDGVWDRGAHEYGGSEPTAPNPPTGLKIIIQ